MKHALLATLIVVNLVLLGWLLYVNTPSAEAQVARGAPDYLTTSARLGSNEALFILDLRTKRMLAWSPDANSGVPDVVRKGVDLRADFGRERSSD